MDILFLCTGNICRSPMAEVLLRQRLQHVGLQARVHSAGLILEGEPASPPGVAVLGQRGLDLRSHRSRRITATMLDEADLVLAMARQHVREAVLLRPDAWPRTFTLKELVRRAEASVPRQGGEPLEAWLNRLHAGRTRADLLGDSPADDVEDPIGKDRRTYERIADELADLIDRLVPLAWGREAA